MFGNLGMGELLVILVIVVILFGAKKLPELGAGLGKGIRSFKDAMNENAKDAGEHPPAIEKK